jgi:hypothetical protein
MSDLDRYLYDQLRTHAAGVDVPAGDIAAVKARGRHRRHRRAGAAALAVVAAAGTVTGVVVSSSSSGASRRIFIEAPTSVPGTIGAQLTWRVVPASAGLSDLTSLSSAGSIAYAVSTAPGVVPAGNQPAQQLYRSADGLAWTTATGPEGLSAAAVAVNGNRVYTVGTGPATAATGSVSGASTTAVSWTDNGGGSWKNSVLPVDLNGPAGALSVVGEAVNVAAGPKGVVAAAGINVTADLTKLVPGVSDKTLWTANANGLEVLGSEISSRCGFRVDNTKLSAALKRYAALKQSAAFQAKGSPPSAAYRAAVNRLEKAAPVEFTTSQAPQGEITTVPCVGANGQPAAAVPADQAYRVVRTYTWSQLDIAGQAEQALLGDPLVFFSSDGTNFHQVSLPAGTVGQAYAAAGTNGFSMVVQGSDGPPVVVQSVDGQHWTQSPFALPAGVTGVSGIGYVDQRLLVVGQTQTGAASYTLVSDGWQASPLPGNVIAVAFGPLGVGVVAMSGKGNPRSWQLLFSRDAVQWSSASLASVSGGAVDGANLVVGSDHVVVTVSRPLTGQPSTQIPTQVQVVGTPAR